MTWSSSFIWSRSSNLNSFSNFISPSWFNLFFCDDDDDNDGIDDDDDGIDDDDDNDVDDGIDDDDDDDDGGIDEGTMIKGVILAFEEEAKEVEVVLVVVINSFEYFFNIFRGFSSHCFLIVAKCTAWWTFGWSFNNLWMNIHSF